MLILGQGALNREDSAGMIIKLAHDIAEKYGLDQ